LPRSRTELTAQADERKARNLERDGVSETDDASCATDNTLKATRSGQARAPEREREEDRRGNVTSGWSGDWKPGSRWWSEGLKEEEAEEGSDGREG
jgi:hypothetical protein